MSNVIDFDAFRAEQQEEPKVFKIGGENYPLPPSLPAALAVDIIRLKATLGEGADVPLEVLDNFGRSIFGEEIWRVVLDKHRLTVAEIPHVLEMVIAEYNGEDGDDEAPKAVRTSPKRQSASR